MRSPRELRKLADRIESHGDDIAAMAWVSSACHDDPALLRSVQQSEEGAGSIDTPKSIYPGILRRIADDREQP